jgi:hypothetical protein
VLNPLMVIAFITVAVAILLLKYTIIPSLQGNATVYQIHIIAGKVFILLGILHIILNWNWVKSQIFGIKAKPKFKKKSSR